MKAAWSGFPLMTFPSWQLPSATVQAEVRSEGRTCEVMKGGKWHQGDEWRR